MGLFALLLPVLMAAVAAHASAITLGQFDGMVDFSATLKSLSTDASETHSVPLTGKLVILTGEIETVDIVGRDKNDFAADLRLIDGQWQALTSISLYRCLVTLRGAHFASLVSARPEPGTIQPNTQLLVVGTVTGVQTDTDGVTVPVVDALEVRPID